ncbi:hypothetical protein F8M41_018291 [Gigaspora margarita]|uniref:Uncharacterized protein n=1 Tax=Gigaspora margarita TaxID=4874 RepID=A0A8H4ALX3_GIGMA|nr:hypothetical protein F8M41_018291 [Gigaspora margarita]
MYFKFPYISYYVPKLSELYKGVMRRDKYVEYEHRFLNDYDDEYLLSLADSLENENERLHREIKLLKNENDSLKNTLFTLINNYFIKFFLGQRVKSFCNKLLSLNFSDVERFNAQSIPNYQEHSS